MLKLKCLKSVFGEQIFQTEECTSKGIGIVDFKFLELLLILTFLKNVYGHLTTCFSKYHIGSHESQTKVSGPLELGS